MYVYLKVNDDDDDDDVNYDDGIDWWLWGWTILMRDDVVLGNEIID